jgi:hypothetical protein
VICGNSWGNILMSASLVGLSIIKPIIRFVRVNQFRELNSTWYTTNMELN